MTALTIPALEDGADTLGAALAFAYAGWYLLPVLRGSKHPGSVVGKGWQHQSSRDTQQIAAWFAGTDHGIALHVGRSGALVFDVDNPDALPEIMRRNVTAAPFQSTRVDTPGRGHYVFTMPPGRTIGNSTGQLGGAWGEIRGLNGVIITQPSAHASGGEYRWVRVGPVPPLPVELDAALADASPGEDAATDAQVAAFLAEHTVAARPSLIKGWLKHFNDRIVAAESRHNTLVPVLAGAAREARAGYFPAHRIVDELLPVFVAKVTADGSRSDRQAVAEFRSVFAWAVGQALAADLDAVRARIAEKMPTETEQLAQMGGVAACSSSDEEHAVAELRPRRTPAEQAAALAACRATFRKWLGDDYDLDALDATLATLAVERLDGDPLWLLVVTGSGNAKTETVCSASDVDGVHIVSSIASEGALLSATSKRERTAEASGGLLRQIGPRGTLVVKDVTTILSMDRTARGQVLAALREIYDGTWIRNVGTDGGRTLAWGGRIGFIGAVTTAWDTHHAVVATMGDRFALLRTSSREGRIRAGRQAIKNTGSEKQMRAELAAAVADTIAGVDGQGVELADDEVDRLLAAADLVTLARTAVEYDFQGRPIQAHEPEMPTRFAKQLAQVLRGAVAVGLTRSEAVRLALRCARDSMPPIRLAIIDHLAKQPDDGYTSDVRKGINLPYTTIDRQLQGLHMLGVLDCDEHEYGADRHRWFYRLADGVEPEVLVIPQRSESSPDLLVGARSAQVGGGF